MYRDKVAIPQFFLFYNIRFTVMTIADSKKVFYNILFTVMTIVDTLLCVF